MLPHRHLNQRGGAKTGGGVLHFANTAHHGNDGWQTIMNHGASSSPSSSSSSSWSSQSSVSSMSSQSSSSSSTSNTKERRRPFSFASNNNGKRDTSPSISKRLRFIIIVVALMVICPRLLHDAGGVFRLVQRQWATADTEKQQLDAIVTVAMCGYTAQQMVQALRGPGRWTRPIYVITNTPEKEDPNLCTPINVKGNYPHFASQQALDDFKDGANQFNPEIWTKWHKTQIFELLPENVTTVMFMDADILAQRPLMGSSWHDEVVESINNPDCHILLYRDRWYTGLPLLSTKLRHITGRYNGGMWVVNRHSSNKILTEWSNRLIRPPWMMGRDQPKFTESIDADAAATAGVADISELESSTNLPKWLRKSRSHYDYTCQLPNHWDHLHNHADIMDGIWFQWFHSPATFLHLSSRKTGEWDEMATEKCDLSELDGMEGQFGGDRREIV
eukprot:CAMPEP_0119562510 /NCGR_PEP_ID=MMETSP1352-20130426/20679_1 /TAXON_ID=265584 /ORGANISM="Stauroneis constricta, Strain CCMP1120" /LENGTH=445 /DNA_ID=CAMNT_0007610933 /DNA_START=89 /DNA_END=1426 /DNA_ORIENTATION=+